MLSSGIYLDEAHTNSLIVKGYHEGFFKPYGDGTYPYQKWFLGEYSNPEKMKSALQALILHEQVFLDGAYDEFTIDELLQHEGLKQSDYFYARNPVDPIDPDDVMDRGLLYPAAGLMKLNNASANESFKALLYSDLYYNFRDNYTRYSIAKMQPSENLKAADKAEIEDLKSLIEPVEALVESIGIADRLQSASHYHSVPALCDYNLASQAVCRSSTDESDYAVCSLIIKNLNRVKVNSLEDALEIRESNFIMDFRNEVSMISQKLNEGGITQKEVKERVQCANKVLDLADKTDKADPYVTIVSVPISLFEPLSLVLTAASIGLVVAKQLVKNHYKWALVSR